MKSEIPKEENKLRAFRDAGKIHKSGRVFKAATWRKSEAIFLHGPPNIKVEKHIGRLHGRGGRSVPRFQNTEAALS